jgi:hypothetical protein
MAWKRIHRLGLEIADQLRVTSQPQGIRQALGPTVLRAYAS